jgi:hypothetical protein
VAHLVAFRRITGRLALSDACGLVRALQLLINTWHAKARRAVSEPAMVQTTEMSIELNLLGTEDSDGKDRAASDQKYFVQNPERDIRKHLQPGTQSDHPLL